MTVYCLSDLLSLRVWFRRGWKVTVGCRPTPSLAKQFMERTRPPCALGCACPVAQWASFSELSSSCRRDHQVGVELVPCAVPRQSCVLACAEVFLY